MLFVTQYVPMAHPEGEGWVSEEYSTRRRSYGICNGIDFLSPHLSAPFRSDIFYMPAILYSLLISKLLDSALIRSLWSACTHSTESNCWMMTKPCPSKIMHIMRTWSASYYSYAKLYYKPRCGASRYASYICIRV
jgi:hypothetical protein